jgi:quercetin dioxygenase-like cupin family protein
MLAVADSGFARTYSIASIPVKLQNDQDLKVYMRVDAITSWSQSSVVTLNGVNLLVTELRPGAMSSMHRTVSIDFSIVTNGEVDYELNGGETIRLRPRVCSVSAWRVGH